MLLRKRDDNAQPALIILERYGGIVQLSHRGDEAQVQSAAWSRATGIEAVEAVENALALTTGDSGAIITHRETRSARRLFELNQDGCAPRCVAQRVLDEIQKHLGEQLLITEGYDIRLNPCDDALTIVLCDRAKCFGNILRYSTDINPSETITRCTSGDPIGTTPHGIDRPTTAPRCLQALRERTRSLPSNSRPPKRDTLNWHRLPTT